MILAIKLLALAAFCAMVTYIVTSIVKLIGGIYVFLRVGKKANEYELDSASASFKIKD
jgi:ammonia channel protein AmtB